MHNFDGIVLEIWSQIPTQKLLDMSPDFIRELARRIRSAGYTFILVIPPAVYQGLFSISSLFHLLCEINLSCNLCNPYIQFLWEYIIWFDYCYLQLIQLSLFKALMFMENACSYYSE